MNNKEISEILLAHQVRPTLQRTAVYRYLLMNPTHPSAETIYGALSQQYPTLSKTTIYNSLNSLIEAGLIRCVTIRADEKRFDGNVADHGHFFCARCGNVFDFKVDSDVVCSLRPSGYECVQGDVYFTGVCPDCLAKEGKEEGSHDPEGRL